ncbi:carbamoyl-phosphate synthase L chain, ATP binding domain-containing protein [Chlamydoabsidia padenii]|nr:carbamoyl-phosphate synthase L chain, ATP binding domain-containing protein [Chlamydoabsidia padenii]
MIATTHTPIHKVLIANRGEIACRVIRTCRRLGIATVAVYSDSDENAPFVKLADEAYHIGPSVAAESYLVGDKLISIAQRSGADALHPGYGFLSENADFADQVVKAGINFIGPTADSIRAIGDKIAAKVFIKNHASTIPLIPGYNGEDQSIERLEQEAKHIEFPVLLKASAGGGGKGMRAVYDTSKLRDEIEAAKGESLRSFGSDKLLIEKYFTSIRHVEIQIFGDKYGNVYHINERDCSIQRRHQKVVEETPSPAVDDDLRQAMTSAAVELGRKLGYVGAGTAEFILDEKTKRFFFLELNTRLQVEHPITEAISGLDLVELQLLVAQGANLKELGVLDNIAFRGHAIEVRLCAEDPDNDFSPRTGVIQKWSPANAAKDLPGVRYDTGIEDGSEISVYYDSMVAKVIVHASTRAEAIQRMKMVLSRTVILGVTTNQKFLISIMDNPRFQTGTFDTNFIAIENDSLFQRTTTAMVQNSVMAATLFDWCVRKNQQVHLRNMAPNWRNVPWRHPTVRYLINQDQQVAITYDYQGNGKRDHRHVFKCGVVLVDPSEQAKSNEAVKKTNGSLDLPLSAVLYDADFGKETPGPRGVHGAKGLLRATINGCQQYFYICEQLHDVNEKSIFVHDFVQGHQVELSKIDRLKSAAVTGEDDRVTPYTSSMPCRVLKILAPTGTLVKKNDPLLSIESMKTEVKLLSRHEGVVTMRVEENQLVDARVLLCQVDEVKKD